jgi:hypothetical protein
VIDQSTSGIKTILFAGYVGGITDDSLTAMTNIFIVILQIIILILITLSRQQRSLLISAIVIGFTTWPWTARAVRAQTASLHNRDHVNIADYHSWYYVAVVNIIWGTCCWSIVGISPCLSIYCLYNIFFIHYEFWNG